MDARNLALAFLPSRSGIVVLVVELKGFSLDPRNELLDLLMLEKTTERVVVVEQFTLTERGVHLLMAQFVHRRNHLTAECLRDKVVVLDQNRA